MSDTTDLIERLDDIIRTLEEQEPIYYVAIELAYQLRDEVTEILSEL